MAMVTKLVRVVTYRKEVPPINLYDPLVTPSIDFAFL